MFTALLSTFLFLAKPVMLEQEMKKGNCQNVGRLLNDSDSSTSRFSDLQDSLYSVTFHVNQPIDNGLNKYNHWLFSNHKMESLFFIQQGYNIIASDTSRDDNKRIISIQKIKDNIAININLIEISKESHWVSITAFKISTPRDEPRIKNGLVPNFGGLIGSSPHQSR